MISHVTAAIDGQERNIGCQNVERASDERTARSLAAGRSLTVDDVTRSTVIAGVMGGSRRGAVVASGVPLTAVMSGIAQRPPTGKAIGSRCKLAVTNGPIRATFQIRSSHAC